MPDNVLPAKIMPEMTDFLTRRRSTTALTGPGPSPAQIEDMLTIAARVPDHGKLAPWRFIVFDGDARIRIGDEIRAAWKIEDPEATEAKLDFEAEKFLRAPLIIAVISSLKDGKAPAWEQELSAGAACFNLCLAANALGFGSKWLTEWFAFNATFAKSLGLTDRERVAGFVYIGSVKAEPEERERPDVKAIVKYW